MPGKNASLPGTSIQKVVYYFYGSQMVLSRYFLFGFFILLSALTEAQNTHTPLLEGDRAYDRKRYKEAEQAYRTAADHEIGNPQAVYNLGNALFEQGKWEDAAQRYEQATNSETDPAKKADAFHNLGDAYLKNRKYKEAVTAYQQSLRLRPADEDTKRNLQMAKKKLKEDEQREKEKKNKQNQDQQNNQNQQNQQPQQNQQNKQNDQNQQNPQQPDNQQGAPQKPQDEQQKMQQEQRLKKEEAKRLLETAVGSDDRKNARKYRAAQQKPRSKDPKKDW